MYFLNHSGAKFYQTFYSLLSGEWLSNIKMPPESPVHFHDHQKWEINTAVLNIPKKLFPVGQTPVGCPK